jgi:hypothetical protein
MAGQYRSAQDPRGADLPPRGHRGVASARPWCRGRGGTCARPVCAAVRSGTPLQGSGEERSRSR